MLKNKHLLRAYYKDEIDYGTLLEYYPHNNSLNVLFYRKDLHI